MVKYRVKKDTVLWKTNELYNDKADALALTIPQAIAYGIIEEIKEEVTLESILEELYRKYISRGHAEINEDARAVLAFVERKIDGCEFFGYGATSFPVIRKSELKKALHIE